MTEEANAVCASIDAEFDRHFGAPESELSQKARTHLAGCARCRELYSWLSSGSPLPAVAPQLSFGVEQTLKSSLKPVKPAASTTTIAARLFLVFVLLAGALAASMNPAGLRIMTAGQLAGISVALLAGALLLSLSLAWQMIPGSLQRVPARTAIAILAAAFLVAVAVLFPWHAPMHFLSAGWHCLWLGSALSAATAVCFGVLVWRGAPLRGGTLGAALGAIAGLCSVAILQSNCEMQDAVHLLVWHGGVLGLSILIGYLICRLEALNRWRT